MYYDFYADMALPEDEKVIDQVVFCKENYELLGEADRTTRAQVLATGLHSDLLEGPIKNGREKPSIINGYPKMVTNLAVKNFAGIEKQYLPCEESLKPLPNGSSLVKIDVKLTRPFTSKDDRAFYPHENPLKRDWIFQIPYLAASGIKGLLRWAWQMGFGDTKTTIETELFGPRCANLKDGDGLAGCLHTWPLFWNGNVGLEVINPHSRKTGAGDKPVKYEVVKSGATGALWFLLFNRRMEPPHTFLKRVMPPFLESLDLLLADSGLSAKRSADWGSVELLPPSKLWLKGIAEPQEKPAAEKVEPAADPWLEVLDGDGNLLPFEREDIYTKKRLAKLTGKSEKRVTGKHRDEALARITVLFEERRAAQATPREKPAVEEPKPLIIKGNSVTELGERFTKVFAGEE